VTLAGRIRRRVRYEAKRIELDVRRRRAGSDDLFIDYGWIRLLYSGDRDGQEIAYHQSQADWHEKDITIFRSLLAPGRTAIDVGANLGFTTTMLASVVGPSGRVLSFEPSPVVYAKLRKTVQANRLANVMTFNLGCGSSPSVQTLHAVSRSSGNSSILGGGRAWGPVEIVRLDDVDEAWERPVSLIKIDTEGYEPEVLAGARRLIEAQRPILFLEMGGDYPESTARSIELLSELRYGIEHVVGRDWSEVGNGSDFFFLPERT
jgi:FkbM family methyltransferase